MPWWRCISPMGKQHPALFPVESRPFTLPWRKSCTDDRTEDGLSLVTGAPDYRLSVKQPNGSWPPRVANTRTCTREKPIIELIGGPLGGLCAGVGLDPPATLIDSAAVGLGSKEEATAHFAICPTSVLVSAGRRGAPGLSKTPVEARLARIPSCALKHPILRPSSARLEDFPKQILREDMFEDPRSATTCPSRRMSLRQRSDRRGLTGGSVPVLSAEVFSIPLVDSKYLIYAPARRSAFVANAQVLNFISQLENGVFDALADPDGSLVELLRALEIVDAGPESPPSAACLGDPQPVSVTLFLTTACNLRCTYCYASAGSDVPKFMTMETARRGIDFAAANAARRQVPYLEVGYHGGGEPTMNWTVLTGSFGYAREKASVLNLELRSSLATNGVLSDARIDWIVAHLGGVSLSCDGLPAVHDRCRRTAAGKGPSSQVLHTLHRLAAAKFSYGIRLTVTAEHISSLAESVEHLCSEFHPVSIQIEPVYLLGRGAAAASAESDEFIEAYRDAAERAAGRGRTVRFSGARAGTLTNHFCSVSRDNFCLSADGNVTACFEAFGEDNPWAGAFFYGRPAADGGGYVFDHAVLNRLRSQAVERREHCRGCFAKWSCGGDCYYKWMAATGGGEFNGSARCHVIRELTKDQILEKIAAAGGMFWHEPPVCPACGQPPHGA